jgi:4'-phosphopantetheinyl transferase
MDHLAVPASPGERTIDVWTADLVGHDDVAAECIDMLDDEERERARRLRFEQHRSYFIRSHAMVRQVLAGYSGIDAAALRFRRGPHGKPSLADAAARFHFSLSHSESCCVMAVRSECPIGIDVERIRELPNAAEIAHRRFARTESAALARLAGALRRDAFFALWTAKEAIVKAMGQSLADNLDRIELDLDPVGDIRFVSLDGDSAIPRAWSVTRLTGPAGFALAVAGSPQFATVRYFAWQGARQYCTP